MRASQWLPPASRQSTLDAVGGSEPLSLLEMMGCGRSDPAEGIRGSIWFLCNRYTPYPNLYPDQSPSEDWTMEERFRPLTFHGLVLRSQLVTLLVRGVCYSESQSVSLGSWCPGRQEGSRVRPCC